MKVDFKFKKDEVMMLLDCVANETKRIGEFASPTDYELQDKIAAMIALYLSVSDQASNWADLNPSNADDIVF